MKVNLSSPINSLGYGGFGLNVAVEMERKGLEPALWPIGPVEAPQVHHDAIRRMIGRTQSYDVNAPSLRIYHQWDLAQHIGRRPHCAYPFFELSRFRPTEVHHLKSQDKIFCSSRWAEKVLRDNGVHRIRVARPGVDRDIFRYSPAQHTTGPTTFINIGKWELRKGHDVLLETFEKAFSQTDNVSLIMHCHNPCFRTQEEVERYNYQWESYYGNSSLADKIIVSTRRLETQQEVAALMAHADCGVFPSRAEGWNLEAAEMLAMGKHVILTDYSAHTEYATPDIARLITVDKQEAAHDGIWFRADNPEWNGNPGEWASLGQSQIDQLVEHMRDIHDKKQHGELKPNEAGVEAMKAYTWSRTVDEIMEGMAS